MVLRFDKARKKGMFSMDSNLPNLEETRFSSCLLNSRRIQPHQISMFQEWKADSVFYFLFILASDHKFKYFPPGQ